MRGMLWLAAAGLAPALWLMNTPGSALKGEPARAAAPAKPADKDDESSCHGTALHFVATPSEAAQQAKKEQKLVFVLHVSGHFEDPSLT